MCYGKKNFKSTAGHKTSYTKKLKIICSLIKQLYIIILTITIKLVVKNNKKSTITYNYYFDEKNI